jgi:hypothetical protein
VTEENKDRIKVVDRRRFTADGEEVERTETVGPTPVAEEPPAIEPQHHSENRAEPPSMPSAVGFLDLVDFLAQQAAALLSGQIPGRGRDPQTARFFIDLLAVVQVKTAGQLSDEEARYLEEILYQLRSLFVATTR